MSRTCQERTIDIKPVGNRTEDFQINSEPTPSECLTINDTGQHYGFFHIQWALVKFKAFYFFFFAAIGSAFPYFSVYFKQLGFSPHQIGIVAGVRPIIGFCSGPLWGSIADRFRVRRVMLWCSALGWLAFITSIGFVPAPEYSEMQCSYIEEFVGKTNESSNSNGSFQTNSKVHLDHTVSRADFYELHKRRTDVNAEETLLESRSWMFDSVDLRRVYVTIIILVVLGELVQSPCGALADSGCIEQLGSNDLNKYGHQRAWGSLGFGIFSLFVGGMISLTRKTMVMCNIHVVISNYCVAFYVFAATMFLSFITTLFFKYQKQVDDNACSKPRPNPLKVFRMFLTIHYGSWLFCMFFTGICNGVIIGFLFWHLENIGATQIVLGVASGVSLFSEMGMFLFVFRILEQTGCLAFMMFGLVGYTVRFTVFALLNNPWIVLPFEVLQGFTFAGVWSVYMKYMCSAVPTEYLGTVQGFLHGIYWGLGAGSGHMIGGIAVENFGARVTFFAFAAASFLNLVVFFLIQKYSTRPASFDSYETLNDEIKVNSSH